MSAGVNEATALKVERKYIQRKESRCRFFQLFINGSIADSSVIRIGYKNESE